jgi:hypothetical protein
VEFCNPREIGSVPRTGSLGNAIGDALDALEMTAQRSPLADAATKCVLRDDDRPREQMAALAALARDAVRLGRENPPRSHERRYYRTIAAIVGRVIWLVHEDARRFSVMSLEAQRAWLAPSTGRGA